MILVELTERLVGLVLDLCRYDECQEDLAALIGAPYPDRLRLPRPSLRSARQEPDWRDCFRRIRTAYGLDRSRQAAAGRPDRPGTAAAMAVATPFCLSRPRPPGDVRIRPLGWTHHAVAGTSGLVATLKP